MRGTYAGQHGSSIRRNTPSRAGTAVRAGPSGATQKTLAKLRNGPQGVPPSLPLTSGDVAAVRWVNSEIAIEIVDVRKK
jgi:hypothetical protein